VFWFGPLAKKFMDELREMDNVFCKIFHFMRIWRRVDVNVKELQGEVGIDIM
jgi:hypothetical protein